MKHSKCSEKLTFLTPWYVKVNRPNIVKWGLQKVVKKCFQSSIFLQLSFWDFLSCLFTNKTIVIKSFIFNDIFLQLSFWDFLSCLFINKTIVIKSFIFNGRCPGSVYAECLKLRWKKRTRCEVCLQRTK